MIRMSTKVNKGQMAPGKGLDVVLDFSIGSRDGLGVDEKRYSLHICQLSKYGHPA